MDAEQLTDLEPADPARRRVHRMCLALPAATVKLSHGSPGYGCRGKIFAYTMSGHHGSDRVELWIKAAPGVQQACIEADPERYYRPKYVGPSGWVGAYLDLDASPDAGVDWPAVAELLVDGYWMLLSKKLLAEAGEPAALVAGILRA